MPRSTRAYGRPGTDVIPAGFEASHALVMRQSFTARCKVWGPTRTPRASTDLSYAATPAATPLYDDVCRLQALNTSETTKILGEDETVRAAYRLMLDRSADAIERGSVVQMTQCSDPTLLADGQLLTVERVTRGSVTWQRDVYAVDRQAAA